MFGRGQGEGGNPRGNGILFLFGPRLAGVIVEIVWSDFFFLNFFFAFFFVFFFGFFYFLPFLPVFGRCSWSRLRRRKEEGG